MNNDMENALQACGGRCCHHRRSAQVRLFSKATASTTTTGNHELLVETAIVSRECLVEIKLLLRKILVAM